MTRLVKRYNVSVHCDYEAELSLIVDNSSDIRYAHAETRALAEKEIERIAGEFIAEGRDPHDLRAWIEEVYLFPEVADAEKLRITWLHESTKANKKHRKALAAQGLDYNGPSAVQHFPDSMEVVVCECGWQTQVHPSLPYPGYHGLMDGGTCRLPHEIVDHPVTVRDPYGNIVRSGREPSDPDATMSLDPQRTEDPR